MAIVDFPSQEVRTQEPPIPMYLRCIQSGIEMVTPVKAEFWLKNHHDLKDRPLSKHRLEAHVEHIINGKWVFNGESIKFGADGQLYDGQHRLASICRTGVTLPLLVVKGLPPEARATLDTHRPRSASDTLHLVFGYDHGKELASVARLLFRVATGRSSTRAAVDVDEFVKVYNLVEDTYLITAALAHQAKTSSTGIMAALVMARRRDPVAVDRFARELTSGVGLTKGSAPLTLLKWLSQQKAVGSEMFRISTLFRACGAIEAYMDGAKWGTCVESHGAFCRLAEGIGLDVKSAKYVKKTSGEVS